MQNNKVLLLNPPGDKIYIRDYYCSKVSKANYIYEPPDLLYLTGMLSKKFEISVVDAIAQDLGPEETIKEIKKFGPDYIIFITGSVSYTSDYGFFTKLKEKIDCKLIGSGDIFMKDYEKRLGDTPFLDAIMLDFMDESIIDYLEGNIPPTNIIYKSSSGEIQGEVSRVRHVEINLPPPDHSLFPLEKYRYPFVKSNKFATVLTDYGCPFRCRFCIMSQIGYKTRSISSVVEELIQIKKLGISEVYFDDQTFGAMKERTMHLLDEMIERNLNIGWCCFSRVDVVDNELLEKMKKAGCHTIMFGVESGSQKLLDIYQKGITKEKVKATISNCKSHGIETVATFIIGLPEETLESANETIKFSLECGCDYASFNIAVPRMGTQLREDAIQNHLIREDLDEMDQSGNKALFHTKDLSIDGVEKFKKKALFRFYSRPSFLLKELLKIRSIHDITSRVDGAIGIVKNALIQKKEENG